MGLPLWTQANQDAHSAVKPLPLLRYGQKRAAAQHVQGLLLKAAIIIYSPVFKLPCKPCVGSTFSTYKCDDTKLKYHNYEVIN